MPLPRLVTPLRSRMFAQVLAGRSLSTLGEGALLVAIVTMMVVQRDSATDLGLLLGVRSAVALIALVFGGVIADMFHRIHIMAIADAVRLVLALCTVLWVPTSAPLWIWAVIVAGIGLGTGAHQPAYQAVVPALVPDEALEAGNALRVLATRGALILGPSAGGLLVAVGDVRAVLVLYALTIAISLATLIGVREPDRRTAGTRQSPAALAAQGVRAVLDRPWIAWVIGSGTIQILAVITPMTVMIPLVLHARGQDELYGIVLGLRAAGSVLGTVLAAQWRPARPGLAAMCGPLTMLLLILFFVVPAPGWVILGAAFLSSVGPALFIVYWPTALQRAVPEDLRGRVFAFDQLGAYILQPIGLALAPLAVDAWGLTGPSVVAALVLVATTFIPLLVPGVATFATPTPGSADERPRTAATTGAA